MAISEPLKSACSKRGFLTVQGTIDREGVARKIFEAISEGHKTVETGLSNRAIARLVLGVESDDALQLVSSLTSPTGKVQKLINGAGGVLLKASASREFESPQEGKRQQRVSVRFISWNEEDVKRYALDAAVDSYVRKADRTREFWAIIEDRMPALESHIKKLKGLVGRDIEKRLALPPKKKGAE